MSLRITWFRPNSIRSLASTLALVAVFVFSVALTRDAQAQTVSQIIEQFQEVQNAMIQAALQSQSGEASEALTTIPETLVIFPIVSALICLRLRCNG